MKRVLMVAFHFPPMSGSSGVHRTLRFSRYLLDYGWQASVLTAHPRVHPNISSDQLAEIPEEIAVERAFALDVARHLSIRGRYPRFLAAPDRWMSWWLGAVPAGLRMIRRFRPDVIWATYPIASALWIGTTLSRLANLPLVADFRDPMTEDDFPEDPRLRRKLMRLERRVVIAADRVVFTTPGMLSVYANRYPEIGNHHWALIENGYDEPTFRRAAQSPIQSENDGRIKLLHSGLLHPLERDPRRFFEALSRMKRRGVINAAGLRIVLRATGHDQLLGEFLVDSGVEDLVSLEPAIPYAHAVREMLEADGLLVFQASSCNHQVPAKLYEYLRAQRPILAVTDPAGDTAATLSGWGYPGVARLDDVRDIERQLGSFLVDIRSGRAHVAETSLVKQYSRQSQAGILADMLAAVAVEHASQTARP